MSAIPGRRHGHRVRNDLERGGLNPQPLPPKERAGRAPLLIANCAENRLGQRLAHWGIGAMAFGTLPILLGVW